MPLLRLEQLEFASYLTYCPRPRLGDTPGWVAHDYCIAMKDGKATGTPPVPIPVQVANQLRSDWASLTKFEPFLNPSAILVPVPSSHIRGKGELWVPEQIAHELVRVGLGRRVAPLLVRTETIKKAAKSVPAERPRAYDHFRTMAIQRDLASVDNATLVDDVITSGGSMLGSANRIEAEYPGIQIRAFAVVRTQSYPEDFRRWKDPEVGTVTLQNSGWCLRRP